MSAGTFLYYSPYKSQNAMIWQQLSTPRRRPHYSFNTLILESILINFWPTSFRKLPETYRLRSGVKRLRYQGCLRFRDTRKGAELTASLCHH